MSKADTLGPAPSFGAVRSARRDAIRKIGGEDATAAVTELPVTVISENPDNPRNHLRNIDETTESVREVGIILPIVVATVDAYLRDRPDRAGDLDDGAQYVVVDGHRRLEASRRVGLAVIPVRVDNGRVATDESLLEAAFIANYHREDMTELEEAHALKQLVDYYDGSQTKACKRRAMSASTLSRTRSRLTLSPELQKERPSGERRVEHVRNLGKLPPAAQKAKADERAEAARQKAETRKARPVPQPEEPADFHGVKSHEKVTAQSGGAGGLSAPPGDPRPANPAPTTAEQEPVEAIPEPRGQRSQGGKEEQPRKLPYNDPSYIFMHLDAKMTDEHFLKLVELGMKRAAERNPDALRSIVTSVLAEWAQ